MTRYCETVFRMTSQTRKHILGIATAGMALVGGCSSEQLYNGFRQNRTQECREMPGIAQERCQARYDESYKDYADRREQELEDESL